MFMVLKYEWKLNMKIVNFYLYFGVMGILLRV